MSRLPVIWLNRVLSFFVFFWWNYDTANLAIFRDKEMLEA